MPLIRIVQYVNMNGRELSVDHLQYINNNGRSITVTAIQRKARLAHG